MKAPSEIPASNIARLPRYYRFFNELSKKDIHRISSNSLAELMGVTASQIRQDFSCFGLSGQQGYGYSVDSVKNEISELLGLHTVKKAILVGVGNLGRAVATLTFSDKGFMLSGAFDSDPALIGSTVADVPVMDTNLIEDFCKENSPECAFLCLPEDKAKGVVEKLVNVGVTCFWNFSHYDIKKDYPAAVVENVHLGDSIMRLSYSIATNKTITG